MVTEFVIGRFGIGAMQAILADISAGMPVEKALAVRTLPIAGLEPAFANFAKKESTAYGPELDWTPLTDDEYRAYRTDPAGWVSSNLKRYAAAMMLVSKLTEERNWNEAQRLLANVIAAEPNNREAFNPYQALAAACRGLKDEAGERAALTKLLELDANASEAAARLLELSAPPPERLADAGRMLETNPFQEQAYRTLATAGSREAYVSLLALEPRDASRLHFEFATLLRGSDRDQARLQVLKALEENPRFEAALELLTRLPTSP